MDNLSWLEQAGQTDPALAFFPCLGLAAAVSLCFAVGLGSLVDRAGLGFLLAVAWAGGLGGLFLSFRRHGRPQALALAALSAVAQLYFMKFQFSGPMLYTAALGLIASSLWDSDLSDPRSLD